MIDNLAADRLPDGDPRNVRAIADQIDEPPAQSTSTSGSHHGRGRERRANWTAHLETGQSVLRVRIHPAPSTSPYLRG